MTLQRPLFMQPSAPDTFEFSALEARALLSSIWRSEGIVRHGPTGSGALKVSQRGAGANFSVDVAAGYAVIEGDDVSDQGKYLVWSTATTNVATPTAPGSGTRVHRVVARLKDKLHNGTWTTYEWTLEVLEDTGSGTPATPASAIALARVTIAAGQASVTDANIEDDRINAMTLLGRPAFGAADTDRPQDPVDREIFWRTDQTDMEIYDGAMWRYFGLNAPYARLSRITSNQSITDATLAALQWNAHTLSSHGGHDNATNNSRYTAPLSGLYRVSASCPWDLDPDGRREIAFRVGGSTVYNGDSRHVNANTRPISHACRLIPLTAGQYVEVVVFQTAGNSLAVDRTVNDGPVAEILWERPA